MKYELKKIIEVADIISGGTPKSSNPSYFGGATVWLTPKDLSKHSKIYINSSERTLTDEGIKNSSAKIIPEGSVTLSSRAPIGYVAISTKPFTTNQGMKSFVPKQDLYNEFLYYYLLYSKSALEKEGSGTTFKEISKSKLEEFPIPIPPISEQKHIVSKIKECFTLLDKSEEKLKQAEEKLNTVLDSSLITIQKMAGGVYPLKEIVTIQKQTTKLAPQQSSFYIALEDIEANTGKLLNQRYATGKDVKSTKLKFNTTHVLYSKLRPYLNKVVLPPEEGVCVTDLLPLLPNEKVTQKYLYYYLRSPQIRNYINQKMAGIKMPRLRTEDLNNMPIFVPTIETQNNFLTRIEQLTEEAYKSKISIGKQMKHLEQLRQSILKKAFEGKLI